VHHENGRLPAIGRAARGLPARVRRDKWVIRDAAPCARTRAARDARLAKPLTPVGIGEKGQDNQPVPGEMELKLGPRGGLHRTEGMRSPSTQ